MITFTVSFRIIILICSSRIKIFLAKKLNGKLSRYKQKNVEI
jgi:hypothetical protein